LQELLKRLPAEGRQAAFSPHRPAIPVTDILFDAWSLTSIRGKLPGRPEVAAFLHGITNDPPETYVAWRHEVALLVQHGVKPSALRDWFRACPLKSLEFLRDRTDRVFQHLAKIRDRAPGTPILLLGERGDSETLLLDQLPKKEDAYPLLSFKTVVLPVEAGGLDEQGMLNGAHKNASDVAEKQSNISQQPERLRNRLHLKVTDGDFTAHALDPAGTLGATVGLTGQCMSPRDAAAQVARTRRMSVSLLFPLVEAMDHTDEESSEYLVLLTERGQADSNDPENAPSEKPSTISTHTADVVERVTKIADALALDKVLKQALILAAQLHDSGKSRDIWQRAIYNVPVTGEPLAKPRSEGMDGRRLAGFRHEFGSLLDAAQSDKMKGLSEEVHDLVLHLIATHHGHGRPHFEPVTYNFECHSSEENEAAARECLRRFARLQLKYGRWQLAWLESLLRCADVAASAEPLLAGPQNPANTL
jgi:CRISPR-associated endonuclease/helicase Cas3